MSLINCSPWEHSRHRCCSSPSGSFCRSDGNYLKTQSVVSVWRLPRAVSPHLQFCKCECLLIFEWDTDVILIFVNLSLDWISFSQKTIVKIYPSIYHPSISIYLSIEHETTCSNKWRSPWRFDLWTTSALSARILADVRSVSHERDAPHNHASFK